MRPWWLVPDSDQEEEDICPCGLDHGGKLHPPKEEKGKKQEFPEPPPPLDDGEY